MTAPKKLTLRTLRNVKSAVQERTLWFCAKTRISLSARTSNLFVDVLLI